jgi:hypothetical protein
MFQPHDIDPRLAVQILQFLWSIYTGRRARSKSGSDKKDADPVTTETTPDPDKLKELIREVETTRPEEGIAAAIDEKFSPADASQIKDDIAAFAILASPPDFNDYDFCGLVQKYIEGIQKIALTADLFRLRGSKVGNGVRLLKLPETSAAFVPASQRDLAVYTEGDIISSSVTNCVIVLTDKQVERPLVIVLEGRFQHVSRLGESGFEKAERAYMFRRGQESNWLAFDFMVLHKNS